MSVKALARYLVVLELNESEAAFVARALHDWARMIHEGDPPPGSQATIIGTAIQDAMIEIAAMKARA